MHGVTLTKARPENFPRTVGKYYICLRRERIGNSELNLTYSALLYKDSSIFLFVLVEKLQELKDYVSILYFSPHFTINFFEGIYKYQAIVVVV